MPELPDQWKLDSGIREDAVMTIVAAYFGTTANYMDGNVTLLVLVGYDENGDEMTEKLSVGADWQTSDGGKTIVHPTKTRVNKNSIYGHWLQSCMEIPELIKTLINRGDPKEAAIWSDLILHLKAKEISFGGSKTGVESRSRLMPIEYLGISSDAKPQTMQVKAPALVQQAPVQQSLTSAIAPATVMSPADVVAQARAVRAAQATTPSNPLVARLQDLARNSASHDDFISAAFGIDEVLADDELAAQCADANGIYAQVRG